MNSVMFEMLATLVMGVGATLNLRPARSWPGGCGLVEVRASGSFESPDAAASPLAV